LLGEVVIAWRRVMRLQGSRDTCPGSRRGFFCDAVLQMPWRETLILAAGSVLAAAVTTAVIRLIVETF
jgi:hypothetical protein